MKNTIKLAALFTILASTNPTAASAGWQDTMDSIFPPVPSPTYPEQENPELRKISGLKETFRSVIENKGVPYKGGVIVPDIGSKHLILRFEIPTFSG